MAGSAVAAHVVIGTPDTSFAGSRLLLSLSSEKSRRFEWKSTNGEGLAQDLQAAHPGSGDARIEQVNLGATGDSKAPAITLIVVNAYVPAEKAAGLARELVSGLITRGMKKLTLLAALAVNPRLGGKDSIGSGVAYAAWNGHPEPASSTGLNRVGDRVTCSNSLLCCLSHYSRVLEVPTLALYARGYRFDPRASSPAADGTEAVAQALCGGLAATLRQTNAGVRWSSEAFRALSVSVRSDSKAVSDAEKKSEAKAKKERDDGEDFTSTLFA